MGAMDKKLLMILTNCKKHQEVYIFVDFRKVCRKQGGWGMGREGWGVKM